MKTTINPENLSSMNNQAMASYLEKTGAHVFSNGDALAMMFPAYDANGALRVVVLKKWTSGGADKVDVQISHQRARHSTQGADRHAANIAFRTHMGSGWASVRHRDGKIMRSLAAALRAEISTSTFAAKSWECETRKRLNALAVSECVEYKKSVGV